MAQDPRQSLDIIRNTHKDMWVLLDRCQFDLQGRIIRAEVVYSCVDRETAYQELHRRQACVLMFLGVLPADGQRPFLEIEVQGAVPGSAQTANLAQIR